MRTQTRTITPRPTGQYEIEAALAADYRRLAGGTRLRDADGAHFIVPARAVQRALGPEARVLRVDDGLAPEIGDMEYPVVLVQEGPGRVTQGREQAMMALMTRERPT